MAAQVVIIGIGLTTAVGPGSRQTATSVRAGIARLQESPWRNRENQPFVLACVPQDALPPLHPELAAVSALTYRESRLLQLAHLAIQEAVGEIAGLPKPLPVYLALSERETNLPLKADQFLDFLHVQTGQCAGKVGRVFRQGRAGALFALQDALKAVASGQSAFALAGGVDSFRDFQLLAGLDADARILAGSTMDGFIPGEGAGMLLLTTTDIARQRMFEPLARALSLKTGIEEGHLGSKTPYQGEGLAKVFQALFTEAKDVPPVRDVYCSMNGENHWAKEWGVGYLRNTQHFSSDFRITHPADCFGDTGAACGTILAGLATLYLGQGLAQSPALVYSSADYGPRAALLLATPEKGK